jgi:hypothetical protein
VICSITSSGLAIPPAQKAFHTASIFARKSPVSMLPPCTATVPIARQAKREALDGVAPQLTRGPWQIHHGSRAAGRYLPPSSYEGLGTGHLISIRLLPGRFICEQRSAQRAACFSYHGVLRSTDVQKPASRRGNPPSSTPLSWPNLRHVVAP